MPFLQSRCPTISVCHELSPPWAESHSRLLIVKQQSHVLQDINDVTEPPEFLHSTFKHKLKQAPIDIETFELFILHSGTIVVGDSEIAIEFP